MPIRKAFTPVTTIEADKTATARALETRQQKGRRGTGGLEKRQIAANYFAAGGVAGAGAGAAGGLMSRSSTSKISTEPGGMPGRGSSP